MLEADADPVPPPPGPLPAPGQIDAPHAPRPGELTPAWRTMLVVAWVGAFLGYAAVWKVSDELGIGTWWLGPRADPQPFFVVLSPFAVCLVMVFLAGSHVRVLPWVSVAASGALIALASADFSRSVGLATIQLTIGGALLVVSAASFTGRYRLATSPDDAGDGDEPSPPPPGAGDGR